MPTQVLSRNAESSATRRKSHAYPLRRQAMPAAESTRFPKRLDVSPESFLPKTCVFLWLARRKASFGILRFEKHPVCSQAGSSPDSESPPQSSPRSISPSLRLQTLWNPHEKYTRTARSACIGDLAFAV